MIRKFKPSDIDKVINIWLEASIKAHDFVSSEFWTSKAKDMREIYIPSSETYVYVEGEIIKGFFSLHKNSLAALFVHPNSQRSGIGKELMRAIKEARDTLTLTVYKENVNSIEFYKKCGFKIEAEQIDKHTAHPELLMTFPS